MEHLSQEVDAEKASEPAHSAAQVQADQEKVFEENTVEDAPASSTSDSDSDSVALNALITEQLLFNKEDNLQEGQPGSNAAEDSEAGNETKPESAPLRDELVALGLMTSMEKLSMLCTMINTLHFWEGELLPEDSWSSIKQSSVYTLIAAARESQKRLFKLLSASDQSRPALCFAVVGELVRAYPPQKLLPAAFLGDLFSGSSGASLAAYQDDESAGFWDMLVTFAACLVDEHGATGEQIGFMLLGVLSPAVEDDEEARLVLRNFLVSHIGSHMSRNKDCLNPRMESCGSTTTTGARSSLHSKAESSEIEGVKFAEVSKRSAKHKSKGLWNAVIGLAWRRQKA